MNVGNTGRQGPFPSPQNGGRVPLPVRLVPYRGDVPEPLAGFFRGLSPWEWRDLRTVFCRFPEVRRLVNIVRTIDLVFEKAPHTLARGHWSIGEFLEAREKISSAIVQLGYLANQVAADSRLRLPVAPVRESRPLRHPHAGALRAPGRPGLALGRFSGGPMKTFGHRIAAA